MKQIKVAIIGYGRSGRDIHTDLLKQLPEQYRIAAVVDADSRRREMIREETGAQALEHYTELLSRRDIDLVVNASFNMDHAPISAELLKDGFHVLSEKPVASNVAELEQLLALAKENDRLFLGYQQYRFAPSYRKVKEVIASGVLGRIVQASLHYSGFARRWDWQTVQSFRAGSLLNTGPHPVDQALDLMGFPEGLSTTAAFDRAQTAGDAEDYAKLLLQADGSPVVDIEISSCNAFGDNTYLIQGTRGSLRGTTQQLEWRYYIEADEPVRELITTPLQNEKGEPQYCRESLTMHTGEWKAQGDEVNDFNWKGLRFYGLLYNTLTQGDPFPVTDRHLLLQMQVMEEAHRQNDARLPAFV